MLPGGDGDGYLTGVLKKEKVSKMKVEVVPDHVQHGRHLERREGAEYIG